MTLSLPHYLIRHFPAIYAQEGKREELRRVLYTSFEDSIYQVYQRLLIVFQATSMSRQQHAEVNTTQEDKDLCISYAAHHYTEETTTGEDSDTADESCDERNEEDEDDAFDSCPPLKATKTAGGLMLLAAMHGNF